MTFVPTFPRRAARSIDDPLKTAALIERIKGEMPFTVTLTSPLRHKSSAQAQDIEIPERSAVIVVRYLGDEGGICCTLDLGGAAGDLTTLVSLTHLRPDRRSPLCRDTDVCQRHRFKKLRRQNQRGS